ncbi:MAG TPA: hypothetical protein VGI40_05485 [Pirellulaceae bacterium]|jgi:hypothetical protein
MHDNINDSRLNRLIDGELSPAEYRAFLAALDGEPGGWRRCALAMLESQALGHELTDLRRSLDRPESIPANNQIALTRTGGLSPLSLLAIAASFFIAFALGLIAPQFFSARVKDSILAGNFNTQPTANETVPTDADTQQPRNVGNLQLVVDNGGDSETRQVPVYEVGRNANDFLTSASPPIGPEIIDLLRRHGYDVQHQQEYLPADLEDGRQMIVPLDGYQITPVSRRY